MLVRLRHVAAALLLPILICRADVAPTASADATHWEAGMHSQVRLIAGAGHTGEARLAGIHIRLDPSWKTYWRSPGDSGLPPRLDWTGSRNLKEARMLWPAPRRFRDKTGAYAGYTGEVVFPLQLTPERAGAPIELNLTIQYATCMDLCVPEEARLALRVPAPTMAASAASPHPAMPGSGAPLSRSYEALIDRYMKRVPALADSEAGIPQVDRATATLESPAAALVVDAAFPAGTEGADLFVEGPRGFYFPAPEAGPGPAPDLVRFTIDLGDAEEAQRLSGETLTLTLISDLAQAETHWTLD